jgi:hypothetical protein
MNKPSRHQLRALKEGARLIRPSDYQDYLQLRQLLGAPGARKQFSSLFARYYRMGAARLTEAFKTRFFRELFSFKVTGAEDPYSRILKSLHRIPRAQGDLALQFSFVSKLVAVHDESQPIWDRNVSQFFGLSYPTWGTTEFRISGFVSNLAYLRAIYLAWLEAAEIQGVLASLAKKHPSLGGCHGVRLLDFLVWTVVDRGLPKKT